MELDLKCRVSVGRGIESPSLRLLRVRRRTSKGEGKTPPKKIVTFSCESAIDHPDPTPSESSGLSLPTRATVGKPQSDPD